MSERWPGGIVRATPVTPTGPLQNGTAPGMWTLDQANYWIKQGLWPIAGNFLAVEDVFSTWLYTGNGSTNTQTITNGINLSGQGGLVWIKSRSGAYNNSLTDTVRGAGKELISNSTAAASTLGDTGISFGSSGFTIGSVSGGATTNTNFNGATFASWTFREAPNFFDVVTFTATNSTDQRVAHNLGSAPGVIILKNVSRTDSTGWLVYSASLGRDQYGQLNTTAAFSSATNIWGTSNPTATDFGWNASSFGYTGDTYVAYLFAHDTSSTGLIQCGSFTANGGTVSVNLGWEPQWLLVKRADGTSNWFITDNMRGFSNGNTIRLQPNTSNAEGDEGAAYLVPTATGFNHNNYFPSGANVIYIAIRRGPMRTPTLGTSVFNTNFASGGPPNFVPNFVVDLGVSKNKTSSTIGFRWASRLTSQGAGAYLTSSDTTAEATNANYGVFGSNTGWYGTSALTSSDFFSYSFRRAPSFFDEVCYTGTGSAGVRAIPHNLGVAPELIISKFRNKAGENWQVYAAPLGATKYLYLNTTDAAATYNVWGNTSPTSTNFYVQTDYTNQSGYNFVTYLFASCPGVSKVGSYTGTGALQTINCGFTTGARFVLIKRTDSTGDWYVWDSARGITSGNDPYLLLNSTAAEVTSTNYVDTDTTGFKVTAAAPAGINANGGSYIFLAIA